MLTRSAKCARRARVMSRLRSRAVRWALASSTCWTRTARTASNMASSSVERSRASSSESRCSNAPSSAPPNARTSPASSNAFASTTGNR